MDDQVQRLVDKAWKLHEELPASKRLLIAISGIPGSGKTTLAKTLVARLNDHHKEASPALGQHLSLAAFIPLDGFHYTRAHLSSMPNPTHAHARRGAAFTFDAPGFLALVQKLREPILPETSTVHAPSFDHAGKDPVEGRIGVPSTVRIVVFEGNYLSLGKTSSSSSKESDKEGEETGEDDPARKIAPEWKAAAELMDELWFVEVEESIARKRLIRRHVASGICEDEEEAARRADENDLVNGRQILEGRLDVQEIIVSKEDEEWKPAETETT